MDERVASGVVTYVKRTDRAAITQKNTTGVDFGAPLDTHGLDGV